MSTSPSGFQDVAAERAVLGSVLMDNSVLANVQEIITPDDLFVPAHGDIFRAIVTLDSRQEKIDVLTVAEQLKTDGKLASAGGPGYLAQLDQAVPFAQNAIEYAKIIKNQATRRLLAGAGKEILELASQETGDVAELLDEAERKVFQIAQKRRTGDLRPMSDLMEEALTLLDKMKQSGGGITGVPSGFVDLDNQLTGFHGGELIVL
ncbi:MAG: replicative DNA helicase, partial [Archangium sp.]|nr:replicative DNA helicase [Archangium sp.]